MIMNAHKEPIQESLPPSINQPTIYQTGNPLSPGTNFINIGRDTITISEDRLKLNAIEFEQAVNNSKEWHTPLGIFITIAVTLCTAEFQPIINIPERYVKYFFFCFLGASAFWLFSTLRRCMSSNKTLSTPEEFVEACKNPVN